MQYGRPQESRGPAPDVDPRCHLAAIGVASLEAERDLRDRAIRLPLRSHAHVLRAVQFVATRCRTARAIALQAAVGIVTPRAG